MNSSNIKIAIVAGLVGASLMAGVQVLAQGKGHDMGGMHQGGAMQPGAMQMHQLMMKSAQDMVNMKMPMDNDTDRMFDKSMADHHMMAIQMAQIELKFGNDPASKRMASKIIAAQKRERAYLLSLAAKAR